MCFGESSGGGGFCVFSFVCCVRSTAGSWQALSDASFNRNGTKLLPSS